MTSTTDESRVEESPAEAATRAARIGDEHGVLTDRAGHELRRRAAGRHRPRRPERLHRRARRHPHLPPAAAAGRGPRRAARPGHPDDDAHRAGDAPADERARRSPGTSGYEAGALEETYPGMTVLNHEWWDPATFADLGTIPAARLASCPRGGSPWTCRSGSTAPSSSTTSPSSSGRCSPHEVVGISGGNKYFFPGVAGPGDHRRLALDRRPHHLGRDHRHDRDHPGARAHQRGRLARPRREARLLRRRRGRQPRPALDLLRRHDLVVGRRRRGLRGDPRPPPRRAGVAGHLGHPGDVRGHLDRRQGLLQARAGRRRRRRGHPLRAAHHRDLRRSTRRSTRSATTAATTS